MRIIGRGWEGLPEMSKTLYKEQYFQPNETYEDWLERVADEYCDDEGHKQRIKSYIHNYWFHPATPVASNAGLPDKGYPVSCFVNKVGDSKKGIFSAWEETFFMGAKGAGIGTDYSLVREVGSKVGDFGKSSGIMPFIKVDESLVLAVSQGGLRRANKAVYLNIHHPEIEEFIELRNPTGDPYRRTPMLYNAVVLTDDFMKAVIKRKKYKIISPKTGKILKWIDAYPVWLKILQMRRIKGSPFILFQDTTNKLRPEEYKRMNMEITQSNLCMELSLHTTPGYSNVCVLSSINLEYWDEYQEILPQFLKDIHRFLDNVLQKFIDYATGQKGFEKAVRGAEYERSIGLGFMGFHYYLQSKLIPFDSVLAKSLNTKMFKRIKKILDESNIELAKEKGACPLSKDVGTMKRNTHITAIAPTARISLLCNMTSSGIEPVLENVYSRKTNVKTEIVKNRYLEKLLDKKGKNTPDVWDSILSHKGSVQHLDFLNNREKETFKTAYEIRQEAIIELASDRQKYIDQAQSINLFITPQTPMEYVHKLHLFAWAKNIKSLYYIRSDSQTRVGNLNDLKSAREAVNELTADTSTQEVKFEECIYCQ
jgi:ribonucleoside-diphosphate reductase alpha chain